VIKIAVGVEVVLDRVLAFARHEQQAADAGQRQFLDHVLSHRLAADRQHFLGLALGRRQQTRPQSGDRNDSDIDRHGFPFSLIERGSLATTTRFYTTNQESRMPNVAQPA
jgi:hypothetical protein